MMSLNQLVVPELKTSFVTGVYQWLRHICLAWLPSFCILISSGILARRG